MSDYTPPTLVTPTPGGNPGDGQMTGGLKVLSGNTDYSNLYTALSINGYGIIQRQFGQSTFYINGSLHLTSILAGYNNVNTVGLGVSPLYGKDARTGLTAADASATTLYTTTAAGQLYRLMGRILATAGTSPSATYTIKWTEGGATITKTLTISALDSDSDLSILIQPDNGTTITAQLTAISGTGTTVNVAATVEQMA